MMNHDGVARILSLLTRLEGVEPLKQLFWSELNYDRINQPIPRREWTDNQRALLAEDPVLFAGAGDDQGFQVIYSKLDSDRLLLTPERTIVARLQREHPYALFVFSNRNQDRWHFVNVKQEARDATCQSSRDRRPPQRLRRITIGPEERLRTAAERIAMLNVAELLQASPLDIQARHDEAFDVEAVTRQFFDQYQTVFRSLQADLQRQTGDAVWAHDYALQFLNRLMFLYFVQRKRWLGDNTEFLRAFWEAYQHAKRPRHSFFTEWLSVLFFEAFNNRFHGGHRQFPDNIRNALQMAPYLNGGLFRQNRLDTSPPKPFTITDDLFKQAFDFLEHYNFTIAEDSPLDQEVAVDPEMIGKVYESLVNVSAEADERGDAGIFYTPRTEIDLMCRLALVDNLANHLGQQYKNLLYEVVFALEPDDKENADAGVQAAGLWEALYPRLQDITVVDPACGSGSFLVGMLHILDDLQARAQQRQRPAIHEDPYDRKKRIIGQSLYGVDVMEWACHVAELRLWLALIIDADLDTTAAHVRREPLLPHFSFKIRCGDSLVQEVGGLNLAHIKSADLVPPAIKRKITHHKLEKLRYYNNDEDREYKTEEQVKQAELRLFREILDAQDKAAEQQIVQLNQRIANPKARQIRLDGTVETTPQMALEAAELQRQVQELEADRERLREAREALRSATDIPFVWDIAFVEVFEGGSGGFDIVVGNPPYVRQERIADPHEREQDFSADGWRERKKLYKAKLARSVYETWPHHFGKDGKTRKLDAKSDLYCYFYLHALSLLNPRGSFSFVTSNSWLDVGYGADLQEFLLRNCRIHLVLDNQVRRTFADADVNTVIVLFSAPQACRAGACTPREDVLSHTARFVMFTVPFEQVVDAVIFEEIEEATERRTTPEYRVFPITQQRLLEAGGPRLPAKGAEAQAEGLRPTTLSASGRGQDDLTPLPPSPQAERGKKGARGRREAAGPLIRVPKYTGDKWGGKYLRAPDIYWRILEKGKDKLVRLGDIAEVRFGIKTGANEFFFVRCLGLDSRDVCRIMAGDSTEHLIEEHCVRQPVVTKTKELRVPLVDGSSLPYRLVLIERELGISCPHAWEYVRWGETEPRAYQRRPTCAQRARAGRWYSLEPRDPPHLVVPIGHKRRPVVGIIDGALAGDNLVEVKLKKETGKLIVAASVFTTFGMLQCEMLGRANFGQGLLKTQTYELADLLVLNPAALGPMETEAIGQAFGDLSKRPPLMIYDEVRCGDRQALEDCFLDCLGFTELPERVQALHELHDAVCRMVWQRMSKTNNSRESRQTYDEWLASGEPFGEAPDEDEDDNDA